MVSELIHASQTGDLETVKRLLAAGADVNARDEDGWPALTRACYSPELKHGFADIVRLLIEAGADIEAPIGYGVRPLMLAAGYGEAEIVATLLNAGADVLAQNEGGYTALAMAKQRFHIDVINMLHEAEQYARPEASSCSTKSSPDTGVITFMKRPGA